MSCAGRAPTRSCIPWSDHALSALHFKFTCLLHAHVDAQPLKPHGSQRALDVALAAVQGSTKTDNSLTLTINLAYSNHNPNPYLRAARAHVDAQPPEPGGGERALEVALAAARRQAAEEEDVVAVRCGVAAPQRRVWQVARHQVHLSLVRLPPQIQKASGQGRVAP